jgi:hypothetical protein
MKGRTLVGLGLAPIVIFFGIGAIIGALCWPYSINTWLEYAHKDPVVTWWQGMCIGFVPGIGHLGIVVAVVTWIAMMFLR